MDDRRLVEKRLCVIYFKFPDNSIIRCLCTSNKDIAECYGIMWKPGVLYDVEVLKPIPSYMFDLETTITIPEEDEDPRELLDRYAQSFVKTSWEY